MTSNEITEYERLKSRIESKFLDLAESFMGHCEDIIFGKEYTDLRYFCYHYYHDAYLRGVYNRLCVVIERLYKDIDDNRFPSLKNGLANLLIYLREPRAREDDQEYKKANIKYWRDMVNSSEVLFCNSSFRKYLF